MAAASSDQARESASGSPRAPSSDSSPASGRRSDRAGAARCREWGASVMQPELKKPTAASTHRTLGRSRGVTNKGQGEYIRELEIGQWRARVSGRGGPPVEGPSSDA